MKIVIIGSGGVAQSLAHAIAQNSEHELVALAGRNEARVRKIAEACNAQSCTELQNLPAADLYIIAVSDSAIETIASASTFARQAIVVHTAGSVEMQKLANYHSKIGVLYPMQTFSPEKILDFKQIPLFVEGSDEEIQKKLHKLAKSLSVKTYVMSSEDRVKLHLAAVFCCNFVNAMLAATSDLLHEAALPLELYRPLIEEMLAKSLAAPHPRDVQTGPARRGDLLTQQKHVETLEKLNVEKEKLIEIYKLISKYIWETSKKI